MTSREQDDATSVSCAELATSSAATEHIVKVPYNSGPWFANMNPEQCAVIGHSVGPAVVLAVAGAGKTETLARRVAQLVSSGVSPARVALVTFGAKAAAEMDERVRRHGIRGTQASTWHSLTLRILRDDNTRYGDWEVDEKDQHRTLVKEAMGYKNVNWSGDLGEVLRFLGICKANLAGPESDLALELATQQFGDQAKRALKVYTVTAELLEANGILTFDDMLFRAWEHLRKETNRRRWAARWEYLLQDECLVPETPVLLDDRGHTMPIHQMVEQRHPGPVLSRLDDGTIVSRAVTGWHRVALNKPMVRLTIRRRGFSWDPKVLQRRMGSLTEDLRYRTHYVVCTADHLVWTPSGWRAAGDLHLADEVLIETCAPRVDSYMNRTKISQAGRARLAALMGRKNRSGVCGKSQIRCSGPPVRGGNGRGLTTHESALLERLGPGWTAGYVVKTGASRGKCPSHYKIDLANEALKIAVEVDGRSHALPERREQDARKTLFLESVGWRVVRIKNQEVPTVVDELLHERVYNSPAPAEVVAIDPWVPRDPFVYDIDVEGSHCFFADGVLVHNCQDSSFAQVTLGEMLARDHRNYMVIGDPAQSIYGFRGSSPNYLTEFAEEWGAEVYCMNRNYRSGRRVIDVANNVLRYAAVKLPVDLIAARDLDGVVQSVHFPTPELQGEEIAADVRSHVAFGGKFSDITILFRTNVQSHAIEEAFQARAIPYSVVGGSVFYERREVKDLLSYLRVATGDDSGGEALRRSLNAPFRYLAARFAQELRTPETGDWTRRVRLAARKAGLKPRPLSSALEWADVVLHLEEGVRRGEGPGPLLREVIRTTRFIEWVERDQGTASADVSPAANINELVRVADRFATVEQLLDFIERTVQAATMQRQRKGDQVLLTSIHRAKGLEWPRVWVVGCNVDILPHAKGDIEEERRLFYVAVTRARDELILSHVTSAGPPSPFLKDAAVAAPEDPKTAQRGDTSLALTRSKEMP